MNFSPIDASEATRTKAAQQFQKTLLGDGRAWSEADAIAEAES
jgi:hypothetical protein